MAYSLRVASGAIRLPFDPDGLVRFLPATSLTLAETAEQLGAVRGLAAAIPVAAALWWLGFILL
jgi:hypothetical protein